MAVDGPRGPIYKAKKGVITFAKKTGFPIVTVVTKPHNPYCFKNSWNKALLPKMFSKVDVFFGKTIKVPKDADNETMEVLRVELENELLKLKGLQA